MPRRSIFATRCETSSEINARHSAAARKYASTSALFHRSSFLFLPFCFFFVFVLSLRSNYSISRRASSTRFSARLGLFDTRRGLARSFTFWLISVASRRDYSRCNGEFSPVVIKRAENSGLVPFAKLPGPRFEERRVSRYFCRTGKPC